jgi:hypothetical protein
VEFLALMHQFLVTNRIAFIGIHCIKQNLCVFSSENPAELSLQLNQFNSIGLVLIGNLKYGFQIQFLLLHILEQLLLDSNKSRIGLDKLNLTALESGEVTLPTDFQQFLLIVEFLVN